MKLTAKQLKDKFGRSFDEQLVRDMAHHVHDGYADAIERTYGLDPDFKRQLIPQVRHYFIQNRIKKLAAFHKDISVEKRFSPTGTEPFCMLKTEEFTLTVSMVKSPGILPRRAEFRVCNAVANDNLFSDFDPDHDGPYNAILVHVPSADNREPEFMEILFPDSDCERWVDRIDLTPLVDFDLEPEPVPVETVDKPLPKLRKRIARKAE